MIYKTIYAVILNICETYTIELREEHKLKVSENEIVRKTFGFERLSKSRVEEITQQGMSVIYAAHLVLLV
jgi:hypothetical protein